MPILWIMINLSDLQSLLLLIFASILYKLNGLNTFAEIFAKITITMNPIAIARFFETTGNGILEHLLAASF